MFKCLRNFGCNKVSGHPGKILSKEEVEKIGDLMGELLHNELVLEIKEEKKPDVKTKSKAKKKDVEA
jgi:hypothetical protein